MCAEILSWEESPQLETMSEMPTFPPQPVDPLSTRPAQGTQASPVATGPSSSAHGSSRGPGVRRGDAGRGGRPSVPVQLIQGSAGTRLSSC